MRTGCCDGVPGGCGAPATPRWMLPSAVGSVERCNFVNPHAGHATSWCLLPPHSGQTSYAITDSERIDAKPPVPRPLCYDFSRVVGGPQVRHRMAPGPLGVRDSPAKANIKGGGGPRSCEPDPWPLRQTWRLVTAPLSLGRYCETLHTIATVGHFRAPCAGHIDARDGCPQRCPAAAIPCLFPRRGLSRVGAQGLAVGALDLPVEAELRGVELPCGLLQVASEARILGSLL